MTPIIKKWIESVMSRRDERERDPAQKQRSFFVMRKRSYLQKGSK